MLDGAKDTFTAVFVEKDENTEFIARYGIDYFPTILWTDGAGEELTRSAQPGDTDEVLGDQTLAMELLAEDDSEQ